MLRALDLLPVLPAFAPAAGDDSSTMQTLRIFGAVVLLVALSTFVTSRTFHRLQRMRIVAALSSGGWLAIAVGFVLGPYFLRVVEREMILEIRPLLMILLGWIGAIVGMQASRQLLAAIPASLRRWVITDAVSSILLVGGIATVMVVAEFPPEHRTVAWAAIPVVLLACAAVGWAPETRSMQDRRDARGMRLAMLIKSGAGLAALIAIATFGVMNQFVTRNADGQMQWAADGGLLSFMLCIAIATFFGLAGRQLLIIAGRGQATSLLIFVGMVTIVAGAAAELSYSPLFATMLLGVVITNLRGSMVREFEWFMSKSEQAVGMLFFLLAGVLVEPMLGVWGWLTVGAIVLARLGLKPIVVRMTLRRNESDIPTRSALFAAPLRQSPIAIVLAVALVLTESSPLHLMLLTIIVIAGLLCELLPFLAGTIEARRSRQTNTPDTPHTPDTPDNSSTPEPGANTARGGAA